jgi:hypothetical protein
MFNKLLIGVAAACVLCVYAVPANAAGVKTATITKAASLIKKTCDDAASVIWKNKGAIAVGTAAVAVASKPEILVQPVVQGTRAVVGETSNAVQQSVIGNALSNLVVFVLLCMLITLGLGYLFRQTGFWRVVPLLIVGLLLCCGIAEAGVMSGMDVPCCAVKPVWDIISIVILIISLFI